MIKEMIENFKNIIVKKYICFNGRADRKEFWLFILAMLLINIVLSFIEKIIGVPVLSGLFMLAMLLPTIGVTARRLHDVGKSGWLQLLCLIPMIGSIIVLVLCIRVGTAEANAYGEPVAR